MKRCSKCKLELAESEFAKNKPAKDGLCCQCKSCRRKHYQENREEILIRQKQFYKENREERLAYQKKFQGNHKEEAKEWREENREGTVIYGKKYRQEHKEERAAYNKAYSQTEKGKKIIRKIQANRKRGLQSNEICKNTFPSIIKVNWHHIDNFKVIALPHWLHNQIGGSREVHRTRLQPYIKLIYDNPKNLTLDPTFYYIKFFPSPPKIRLNSVCISSSEKTV